MKLTSIFWIPACAVAACAVFGAGMSFSHAKSAATRPSSPPSKATLHRVGDQVALVLTGYGQTGPKTIIAQGLSVEGDRGDRVIADVVLGLSQSPSMMSRDSVFLIKPNIELDRFKLFVVVCPSGYAFGPTQLVEVPVDRSLLNKSNPMKSEP